MEGQTNTQIIDLMKEQGLKEGSLLEITLSKDAAYDNGATPAPTVNPRGYERYDDNRHDFFDSRPNFKLTGYVRRIAEDRITMVNVWPMPPHHEGVNSYYVENDVIADFNITNKRE